MPKKKIIIYSGAKRELESFGQRLRDARLRRRFSKELVCQRGQISRPTLDRIEAGDPSVAFGNYIHVLRVLGMTEDIALLAAEDTLGRKLQDEALPLRKRAPKRLKTKGEHHEE